MFKRISKIFGGDPHKKKIDAMVTIVNQINALESAYEDLEDDELKAKTTEFRERLSKNETLDSLLPEAFAAVREASKRALGQRHFDVQLICGINLHRGNISEMRTGEGKTLAATLPLYLNALLQKGVHLVTVNDYLARRDGRWMGAIYEKLGMSVGILQMSHSAEGNQVAYVYDPNESSLKEELFHLRPVHRAEAYKADITYGTNSEFGFDYLRDNITMRWEQRVQRGHYFAIIDEVDNILIDEARTPLIISGPSHEDSENYYRMAGVVKALIPEDYEVSEKDRTATLTEVGFGHVEEMLGFPLRDPDRPEDIAPEQARQLGFLEQALRAQFLFHRNKEYIVQNNQVVIVDEFTGRLMPGRRWSDGLHQAVEAKEGVKVQAENITHATITIQNYFRMYEKLSGMTGTALTEEEEFFRIYGLEVLAIPTNLEYLALKPEAELEAVETKDEQGYRYTYYRRSDDTSDRPLFFKRKDYPDIVYRSLEGKLRAIVKEIITYHLLGRPQLVGTTSVESSERLSERLTSSNVRRLLQTILIRQAWSDKNNIKEADIIRAPELETINVPLDQIHGPELRRLGKLVELSSLEPTEPQNLEMLLSILSVELNLKERLISVINAGVSHQVLNARKHTEESMIIAGAGAFGAVTIATNMAGRGVDIKLGGELPEEDLSIINHILTRAGHVDPYNLRMSDRLEKIKAINPEEYVAEVDVVNRFFKYMEEMERVRQLGGLHVIGSERHEARRIDNQLRGRAARQGDPGSSRFFLSLEDELMRLFGGEQVEALLTRFNIDENIPIESGIVSRLVEQSQTRVEGANFDSRKHLLEYDDVLNDQRKRIYSQRDRIFTKEDLREDVNEMLRVELGNRIKNVYQADEERWKLIAYLEDIQPPLNFTWLSYPSFGLKLLIEKVGDCASESELYEKLLQISEDAIATEHHQILSNVSTMLKNSKISLENSLSERFETLHIFLENLQEDSENRENTINSELSNLLHFPIRLNPTQIQNLVTDPMSMENSLKNVIRSGMSQIMIHRLVLTFEKRLKESWNIKISEFSSQSWDDVEQSIVQLVKDSLSRKTARLLGDEGEIARDLQANKVILDSALKDDGDLMRLLILITQGKVLTFDSKSHRKQFKAETRLSYVFLLAELIKDIPTDVLTKNILDHLETAVEKFVKVFGNAELENLQNKEINLVSLPKSQSEKIATELGEEVFEAIKEKSLIEIDADIKEQLVDNLGKQTQNRIYRNLLLGTITEAWVEYLTRMEALRVSISMESYAQRDPLVQYKSEASRMFTELLSEVRAGVISRMFRYRPTQAADPQSQVKTATPISSEPEGTKQLQSETKPKKKKRKRH